jgi:hypothetical protein
MVLQEGELDQQVVRNSSARAKEETGCRAQNSLNITGGWEQ